MIFYGLIGKSPSLDALGRGRIIEDALDSFGINRAPRIIRSLRDDCVFARDHPVAVRTRRVRLGLAARAERQGKLDVYSLIQIEQKRPGLVGPPD
jgi:hypothetical protein